MVHVKVSIGLHSKTVSMQKEGILVCILPDTENETKQGTGTELELTSSEPGVSWIELPPFPPGLGATLGDPSVETDAFPLRPRETYAHAPRTQPEKRQEFEITISTRERRKRNEGELDREQARVVWRASSKGSRYCSTPDSLHRHPTRGFRSLSQKLQER